MFCSNKLINCRSHFVGFIASTIPMEFNYFALFFKISLEELILVVNTLGIPLKVWGGWQLEDLR